MDHTDDLHTDNAKSLRIVPAHDSRDARANSEIISNSTARERIRNTDEGDLLLSEWVIRWDRCHWGDRSGDWTLLLSLIDFLMIAIKC